MKNIEKILQRKNTSAGHATQSSSSFIAGRRGNKRSSTCCPITSTISSPSPLPIGVGKDLPDCLNEIYDAEDEDSTARRTLPFNSEITMNYFCQRKRKRHGLDYLWDADILSDLEGWKQEELETLEYSPLFENISVQDYDKPKEDDNQPQQDDYQPQQKDNQPQEHSNQKTTVYQSKKTRHQFKTTVDQFMITLDQFKTALNELQTTLDQLKTTVNQFKTTQPWLNKATDQRKHQYRITHI